MTTQNPSTEAKITLALDKAPIDKKSVKDALKSLRSQVRVNAGLPVETKSSAKKILIAANKASKKAELLALLTAGREAKWNPCRALEKAVQAVKLGATPVEIQGCTALLKIADWPALEENVRLYSVTVKAPVDLVVAALCAKVEPPQGRSRSGGAPKANPIVAPKVEPPKAGKAVTGDWPSMGSANPARVEKRAAVAPAKPAKPAKVA